MSDSQAAWTFGRIFEELAKAPITDTDRQYARRFFDLSMEHDFGPCDMEADEACLALGLAVMGEDPDYPGEEVELYPCHNGYEAAMAKQAIKVTPIEANLPHAVGPVVCGNCAHRAISARPADAEALECPRCGEMAMVEGFSDGQSVRVPSGRIGTVCGTGDEGRMVCVEFDKIDPISGRPQHCWYQGQHLEDYPMTVAEASDEP